MIPDPSGSIGSLLSSLAPLAVSFGGLFQGFVLVLFVISALMLIAVILLQEGKGGGLAGAFGGAAAETFGVKAGTVNRFTAILATVFVGLALLHAGIVAQRSLSVIPEEPRREAPPEPSEGPAMTVPDGPAMGETPPDGAGMDAAPPTPPPAEPPAMDGDAPPPSEPAMGETPPEAPPAPMDGGG